jgi:subtilisin family serine protease
MSHKLDPELRLRLDVERSKATAHRAPSLDANAAEPAATEEEMDRVPIILEFTGDLADLTNIGFETHGLIEHPAQGYKIATGMLPANRIEDLAEIEHLVTANLPRTRHPLLNFSRTETRADRVHTGSPSRKGAGVVIGVIDTGIDWRHGGFLDFTDRESRVLAIWDQLLTAQSGETAGPNSLGVVYTQAQISRALRGQETVRALDAGTTVGDKRNDAGHGTHVAGIAAGDGAPASCCTPSNTYIGLAPLAELIAVRSDFTDNHLTQAIDFIFSHPAAAGKPIVINMSLGGHVGPHDGTEPVERHIDAAIAGHAGRAIVVAAGNEGAKHIHVEAQVSGNTTAEVEFEIAEEHESSAFLSLWYDRAGTLNLEVVAAGGTTSGVVNHGTTRPPFVANPTANANRQSTVSIIGAINASLGRDNNFLTIIQKPTKGNIPHGSWKLRLINPTATAVKFHCWIAPNEAGKFLPPVDPPDGKIRASSSSTIGTPGTAAGAITVANHASKTSACDCWPSTGIVASSSRGPVARGAAVNPKPDIAAPGLVIDSSRADAANLPGNCCSWCPDACCVLYEDKTGTSMSAPHVTGAIALMLEENPNLTKAQILQHLQNSARDRPTGGRDDTFGAGKLDVEAAIASVRATGGGGGGPLSPPDFVPTGPMDTLASRPDEWGVSATPQSHVADLASVPDSLVQLPPALRLLRARIEALPEGAQLAAGASRHFSEVRRLINTNRRVAAICHRSDGPRLLRRLVLGPIGPEAPAAILTERQRVYLDRFCDQLAKYGSHRLSASIERYRDMVIELLHVPLAAQITAETGGGHG